MSNFLESFNEYSEKEKTMFSKVINKLINEKYVTAYKVEDSDFYYFIKSHLNTINEYLKFIDMEVKDNSSIKVMVLHGENSNKLTLSKINSIILLILRLLYNKKIQEVSISNNVFVTTKDIRDLYNDIGFSNDKNLSSAEISDGLKLLKKYNVVDYKGNEVKKDDFMLTIYPTIITVLESEHIESIYNRINSYKGDNYEETYED